LTWSALLSSIYFMGGCVLCCLGLLGEYVGRIFEQVKGRPLYILKDMMGPSPQPKSTKSEIRNPKQIQIAKFK
jgi:hypothetical protein